MQRSYVPDMVAIVHRGTLDLTAGDAWLRIGSFFDLHRFLDVTCTALAGDGALGSVRLVNDAVVEPMVGKTAFSYTYAQTHGPMSAHAYHGSVSCEPLPQGCELVYAIVYDQSGITPEKRHDERLRLEARFGTAHAAMMRAAV